MKNFIIGAMATVAIVLSGIAVALVGGNQSVGPQGIAGESIVGPAGPQGQSGRDGKDAVKTVLGAAGDIVTNVVTFTKGAKMGDVTSVWLSKTLEVGQNQIVIYRNQTGKDQFSDIGQVVIPTGSIASSTSKFYILSTTTASVGSWADFGTVSLLKGSFINGMTVATSSTASTTSSILAASKGQGNGSIVIPDGGYLIGYLQQNIDTITGCRGVVGLCEAATSTKRGFNPVFKVRIHD